MDVKIHDVVIALFADEKKGILEGRSYRVVDSTEETVTVKCGDWKNREFPQKKFKSTNPKPMK